MSQNNSPSETDLVVAAINNSINVINDLASKAHNIVYDSTLNKTKIYGHTNFEELNVLGKPVALQEQLPDMSTKADVGHNHDSSYAAISHTHELDEVVMTYEEEEDFFSDFRDDQNTGNDDQFIGFGSTERPPAVAPLLDYENQRNYGHTADFDGFDIDDMDLV